MNISEDGLLKYASSALPAVRVTLVDSGRYDTEVVHPVLIFTSEDGRECALGLTRELWDHRLTVDLVNWLEHYGWRERVKGRSARKLTLGEKGWIENAAWYLK